MLLGWLDARHATEVGISLADLFASGSDARIRTEKRKGSKGKPGDPLRLLLQRAEREFPGLSLNFYKRAKLANAFKWRLLEKGVTGPVAAQVTQTLIMHLSMNRASLPQGESAPVPSTRRDPKLAQALLDQSAEFLASGEYERAVAALEAALQHNPRHSRAMNNLGAALCKLGRYQEGEKQFRRAIAVQPDLADAHANLGGVLLGRGHLETAEQSLRRALKLNPRHTEARSSLGLALYTFGRTAEAKRCFEKLLRVTPMHAGGLLGMAKILSAEGYFDEAEKMARKVLAVNPDMPAALAALARLRRMTSSDEAWLRRAERVVSSGLAPFEEIELRFAIGKHCDDIGAFARAFQNYKRGNELLKANAEPYDREARARFTDDMIRVYAPASFSGSDPATPEGPCASTTPVFVVGMMRSGTSLVEQIIASHPAAAGAGELGFWLNVARQNDASLRQGLMPDEAKRKFAKAYLDELVTHSRTAQRIVDKAPANSDLLGLIHSVLPGARIIYMRRNPIDTCLSCYFQQFSAALNFTMDLGDLAHYYQQHLRLIGHWRTVLPPGTLLDVPYSELVQDQEGWTRKILEFIGLPWDERCLSFHNAPRTVATSSAWQVRQKIYKNSIDRWHNYEAFIGPLRALDCLD